MTTMIATSTSPAISPLADAAVLVASGDAGFRKTVLECLAAARRGGIEAHGGADALLKLELAPCAGVVLDRQLPDLDAEELVGMLAAQYPQLEVAMFDSMIGAQVPVQAGPMDFREFLQALRAPMPGRRRGRAAAMREARAAAPVMAPVMEMEREPEPARAAAIEMLPGLVGRSAHLGDVSGLVRLVAPRRTTVLLLGETGTGKEMIAQAVHAASERAKKPFAVVNCAAIPEALLESELFGYVRGAFTGAVQTRAGRIQAAHGGTLFLDEIGELPLGLQAKLLRFLQEGEVQRLGSNEPQKVDVRVIAATNVDLAAKVESGAFRRDLYYRLAVFPIELQALRERPADIVPLARHFLAQQHGVPASPPRLAQETADLLERYPWPGNVRELQHAVERAYILGGGAATLRTAHFPALEAWTVTRGIGPCRAESNVQDAARAR